MNKTMNKTMNRTMNQVISTRYVRLKLKMLFLVVLGTVVAVTLGIVVLKVVIDGILQDPFAKGFVWCAIHWFGYAEPAAIELYHTIIRNHKRQILTLLTIFLMLIAFYIAMGRFTYWLDQIGAAVRQVVSETGEPVQLPKELAPVQADLIAIQRTLEAREVATRGSEQRRSDLVSFLAHDLKTPLTSVLGYLNLLSDGPDLTQELRSKYTGIALDKARRLEELISEFFDITRLDLEGMNMSTSIQLSVLLEQLVDEFYPAFEEKELTCSAHIQPRLFMEGDPDKLARVLDNVLRNAVNYSDMGGVIDIEAKLEGDGVEISVSNEGLAIPEQELSNIFHKFYRLDAARSTRTGGAGLGLAIAQEIVLRHGGSIRAESNGKRTSFLIWLPTKGVSYQP